MSNLHAHISVHQSDCDGPTGYDYVAGLSEAEAASDFPEFAFEERIVGSMVSFTGLGGTLTVAVGDDWKRAEWHEQTEEGFRFEEALFCEDESCDPNARGQYDVYAEIMGY